MELLICRTAGTTDTLLPLVQLGASLPGLPKKLVEKIEVEEFINFGELSPAKGKGRPLSQAFKGQVLVIHEADLVQTLGANPRLSFMDAVFWFVYGSGGSQEAEKGSRIDGLFWNNCKGKPKIQMTSMDHL